MDTTKYGWLNNHEILGEHTTTELEYSLMCRLSDLLDELQEQERDLMRYEKQITKLAKIANKALR